MSLNSALAMSIATTAERRSATGPANTTPSIAKNRGSTSSSGIKKSICLVSERNIPFTGLPIDVKNVEIIGCKQLSHVKNSDILKNLAPNS